MNGIRHDLPVSVKNLRDLNHLNLQGLDELEQKLGEDYKILAQEFNSSKLTRADEYLAAIGNLKNNLLAQKHYFNQQMNYLHDLQACYGSNEWIEGLHPRLPEVPEIPLFPIFNEMFGQTIGDFNEKYKMLACQYGYDYKNLERQRYSNFQILWRQYAQEIQQLRRDCPELIAEEIEAWEKDFYRLSAFKDEPPSESTKSPYKMFDTSYIYKPILQATPDELYDDLYKIDLISTKNHREKLEHQKFLNNVMEKFNSTPVKIEPKKSNQSKLPSLSFLLS